MKKVFHSSVNLLLTFGNEQLLHKWVDAGNKGSSEYTKGTLQKVQCIFTIIIMI